MPSIKIGATLPGARNTSFRRKVALRIVYVILISALLLSGAAPEKHLSVYSVAANYSLPLLSRDGRDYVGLLELLEPLGNVTARNEGGRWRLHFSGKIEADFQSGKDRARIQGRDVDLLARFLIENGRGLVPVSALSSLLPRLLGGPVTFHEDSSRLFIGSVATHFTAILSADNPPRLVFHFTAPVSPSISTDPGRLRMAFTRDPLVAPASPALTFGNKIIPSANYSESDGTAFLTVNSNVPVMANFSADGRIVTIAPIAPPPQNAAHETVQPLPQESKAAPPSGSTPAPAVSRRYFAVVDPSHGGTDHGETFNGNLLEKDITLALARSLRQELESRGIPTLVLRDSDADLSPDQRAALTNTSHAAVYISLHAASSGHGIRIYTALLPYGGDDRGPFRSWNIAQHSALAISQNVAGDVSAELQKRQMPSRLLSAALRPLNNLTAAAFAVEVAPQGSELMQLTAPDYQQLVTSAVATAIAADRDKLGTVP